MTFAVDACLGRGAQVHTHLLEVDADGSEEVGHRVLALALEMELHHWEQSLDGWLVDNLIVILSHDGVGEDSSLTHQLFVATAAVELQDEAVH